MNLLIDQWIPVRPLESGGAVKISLRELLCGEGKWELCLPRDDMELAAMQLLICITQTLFTPRDGKELLTRIAKPIAADEYEAAVRSYADWFCVDHPKQPFMQVRGVAAKDPTPMDKLLAGVTGATNCCFVNENGLSDQLCGGCTSIALFNLGSCSPSFGGGFKPGLRGPATPITTLVQGRHLRETSWLNVLTEEAVERIMPWYQQTQKQQTTWIEPIKAGEKIAAQQIGLIRGLFWQPACVEVSPANGEGVCSCCGFQSAEVYTSFNKAKFNYSIEGTWPHPHSPLVMTKKNNSLEEKFASFGTSSAPSWTQLARFVVQQEVDGTNAEGHQPATVVQQVRKTFGMNAQKLHLIVGGYQNRAGQASVVGRRHEVFTLNHGWDNHPKVIGELVFLGRGYRDALYKALSVFIGGIKESKGNDKVKGAGVKITQSVEAQFYRRSEPTIEDTLARIDFDDPVQELARMRSSLKTIATALFDEATRPYLNDPQLIKTLAVARRTLFKHLNNLEPQQNKGGDNGTAETP